MSISRRDMLAVAVLSSASSAAGRAQPVEPMHMDHDEPKPERPKVPRLPAILCRTCDTLGVDAAYRMLQDGADTLDAALWITRAQEDNPNDLSTGLGGLPDEDGVVQLDACCIHGPSGRSAAVASVSGVRNASLLARAVMEKAGYASLAGAGAARFAASQGFADEQLTNERSHKMWALWQQTRAVPQPTGSVDCDPSWPVPARKAHFLPASQKSFDTLVNDVEALARKAGIEPQWTWRAAREVLFPSAAPLYVSAVNAKSEMSCAATTSGLPWRMAGATSDVPMLGAGCFLDPKVGSAGASGDAEANTKVAGARLIVQNMKDGMSPEDAGMDALRNVAERYDNDMGALRFVELVYFVQRLDGAYACVSLWRGDRTGHVRTYTIHDGLRRSEPCLFLFDGSPLMPAD